MGRDELKFVYCAVDNKNNITALECSNPRKATIYYKTDKILKQRMERENTLHPDRKLRIAKFKLVEV